MTSYFTEVISTCKNFMGTELRMTNINEPLLNAVAEGLGSAIHHPDASLVTCSDREEIGRVKTDFLIGTLHLADSKQLDNAITEVCKKMGVSNRKIYRVVFYYLLMEHLGLENHFLTSTVSKTSQTPAAQHSISNTQSKVEAPVEQDMPANDSKTGKAPVLNSTTNKNTNTTPAANSTTNKSTDKAPVVNSTTNKTTEAPVVNSTTNKSTDKTLITNSTINKNTEAPVVNSTTNKTTDKAPVANSTTNKNTEAPVANSTTNKTTDKAPVANSTTNKNTEAPVKFPTPVMKNDVKAPMNLKTALVSEAVPVPVTHDAPIEEHDHHLLHSLIQTMGAEAASTPINMNDSEEKNRIREHFLRGSGFTSPRPCRIRGCNR